MNRTTLKNIARGAGTLAIATAGTALLLATRAPSAAPVGRRTEVHSVQGRIHVKTGLSHGAVLAGRPETITATVTVGADRQPRADRANAAFVLVLDHSGSMQGEKIEMARQAAASFVHQLDDGDMLAIVAFDSAPSILVEPGSAGELRARALSRIAELPIGGGTNIHAALHAALQLLPASADTWATQRVILVSDGLDESGQPPARIVALAESVGAAGGRSISTVGIGADYNEELMTRVADVSHGNYHFLRDGSALARVLAQEAGETSTIVATGVTAEVSLPPGVTLVRASGALLRDRSMLDFGTISGGDERRAVLELAVAPATVGAIGRIRARVRYVDRETGAPADAGWLGRPLVASSDEADVHRLLDAGVLEEGLEVAATFAHDEARDAWENADMESCRAIENDNVGRLRRANALLHSQAIADQIREVERSRQRFEELAPGSEEGRLFSRDVTVSNRGRWARDSGGGS